MSEGVKSDAVLSLQSSIKSLGFYSGSLTGNYGSITAEAVRKFQRKHGLTADGVAGKKTLEKVASLSSGSSSSSSSSSSDSSTTNVDTNTILSVGSRSSTVTSLQKELTTLGFYSGSITGNYGDKTKEAVIKFQKKNGLTADGVAGKKTLTMLFSASASSAGSSTSTVSKSNASSVKNTNWFTMRGKYKNGIIVTAYDFATGYSWKLKTMSKDKHWDMEPVSTDDVTTMFKAFGNKTTWTPKAVWITFPDGTSYIASTANTPHGTSHIANNNFKGHLCVHFPLSMETAEGIGPNAVAFQKAITAGWTATQKLAGN